MAACDGEPGCSYAGIGRYWRKFWLALKTVASLGVMGRVMAVITLDVIRRLSKFFPGAQEGTSYGTPAIRVAKKLMLRLHDKEDAIVVLLNSVEEQQALIAKDPLTFYITDHYEGYAAVLVRPTIPEAEFRDLMELAWRRVARKRDLEEYGAG